MTRSGDWAFLSESGDFSGVIDLVILEDSELLLLSLMLIFLWGGILLLLSLFTTTTKSKHQVKG